MESGPRRNDVGCWSMTGSRSATSRLRLIAKSRRTRNHRLLPLSDQSGRLEPRSYRVAFDAQSTFGVDELTDLPLIELQPYRVSRRKPIAEGRIRTREGPGAKAAHTGICAAERGNPPRDHKCQEVKRLFRGHADQSECGCLSASKRRGTVTF